MRKKIEHGTVNTYTRHGCRCSLCRARNAEESRKNREKNREYFREAARKSYAKHRERLLPKKRAKADPEKNKARCAVRYAISKGILSKGECEVGIDCWGDVHAHHDDYCKPLEVRWFCRSHHAQLHGVGRKEAEGPIAVL